MSTLRDWQYDFLQVLTSTTSVLPAHLCARDANGVRLAIYRNNWRGNLRNALRIAYPVVVRLVGDDFFAYAAHCFIDEYPSRSANLDDYGREFPQFLRTFSPAQTLPYLGDVAALEAALDAISASSDETVRLRLHSPFPVLKIWQSNQPGWPDDTVVNLADGPDTLLLRREQGDVVIEKDGN